MTGRLMKLLIVIFILAFVLGTSGCGGEEESPTPVLTPSPLVTQTPEPTTLKLVTSAWQGTPRGDIYFSFEELVEDYTDGRVLIDIFPNSQLFPTTEEWEAVVTGSVDIVADSSYYISPYVPDVMISYIDALWESYDHAYAALEESELPQLLAEKVAEAGPVKLLGILPGAMVGCVLNTVGETKTFADLEGLRCQGSPGSPTTSIYDYSGMTSIPISLEEVSTAFIQGIIDAVFFPPTAITGMNLEDTGNHVLCSPTSFFFMTTMVIHEGAWESLTITDQDIILNQVMPEMYELAKKVYRDDEQASLDLIEQNVDTMHWVTPEDLEPYKAYIKTHPVARVQMLMIDPEILQIIDDLRPSRQQQ